MRNGLAAPAKNTPGLMVGENGPIPGLRNCAWSGGVALCGTNEKDGMLGVIGMPFGPPIGEMGTANPWEGDGSAIVPGCAGFDCM